MQASSRTVLFLLVTLLILIACDEKKQETASETSSPSHTHSVAPDTASGVQQDSIDEKGRPLPPIPIEKMTREQLAEYKLLLTEREFYSCCVKPTCRMCLFEFEECPCEHNLKKGAGVCGECYEGWQVGKGNVAGIKQQNVKKLQ